MHSGGLILSTFMPSDVGWTITPRSSRRSQIASVSSPAGSSVSGSRISSRPRYSPSPWTAPQIGWRSHSSLEPRFQVRADDACVLLQPLGLQRVEHGERRSAACGAAAGGGEERTLALEARRDRIGRDHRGDREPVPCRLRDRDHIRHDALLLEPPEVLAEAPVSDLDLVGDAESARSVHGGIDTLQVPVGQLDPAGVAVGVSAMKPATPVPACASRLSVASTSSA